MINFLLQPDREATFRSATACPAPGSPQIEIASTESKSHLQLRTPSLDFAGLSPCPKGALCHHFQQRPAAAHCKRRVRAPPAQNATLSCSGRFQKTCSPDLLRRQAAQLLPISPDSYGLIAAWLSLAGGNQKLPPVRAMTHDPCKLHTSACNVAVVQT